jgi:apolipoprotein N-acyltransferase
MLSAKQIKPEDTRISKAWALLAGLSLGLAFLRLGTVGAIVLGWLSVLSLSWIIIRAKGKAFPVYLAGVIAMPIGFYWLPKTIADFGGFSYPMAGAVFLLFVVGSAAQFFIFAILYRCLPHALDSWALRIPLAWVVAEQYTPRIFPWEYAHTQLAFTEFVQISDLGGSCLVGFLMFWMAASIVQLIHDHRSYFPLVAPLILMCVSFLYGTRVLQMTEASAPELSVSVIQGNVSIAEKHSIKYFQKNTDRYRELSATLPEDGRLIIWPESVVMDWVSNSVGNAKNDYRLPQPTGGNSYLLGSLTYDPPAVAYNSAIAIYPSGEIPHPYHKRILMPFGEYVPFSDQVPWLKKVAHLPGEFQAGSEVKIFEYPLPSPGSTTVQIAPLICYEDLMPELAREATLRGAKLLVNLTNDAWFGNTAAPRQHHVMAAFRAIENRRSLIRATNSGLTGIIDPTGRTVQSVSVFSEAILSSSVKLYRGESLFTVWVGPWGIRALLVVCLGLIIYSKLTHARACRMQRRN